MATHPEVGLTPGGSGVVHSQEPPSCSVPQLEREREREKSLENRQCLLWKLSVFNVFGNFNVFNQCYKCMCVVRLELGDTQ